MIFFEFFVPRLYLKKYDLSDEEIEAGITGSGGDGGCDSIFITLDQDLIYEDTDLDKYKDGCHLKMYIFQTKQTGTFKELAIKNWKEIVDNLLDIEVVDSLHDKYSLRYNKLLLDKIELFLLTFKKLIRKKPKIFIEFIYSTLGAEAEIHANVVSQSGDLIEKIKEKFPSIDTTKCVVFLGVESLKNIYDEPDSKEFSLKFYTAPSVDNSSNEYVGLVSLAEYYNFITKNNVIQRHIFEANVRDYQGGTIVNKQILQTLKEPIPEDFWWLNNGVTILAEKATLNTAKDFILLKPEVVNGLQTSYTIFDYFDENREKLSSETRRLLVRVVIPPDDTSRDRIILATNSQTNIPKASLRATDPIHRDIEQYFTNRGLYYDRRKNYYKNMGKKSNLIVGVPFLAQCLISILLGMPDYARARPSSCLSDDRHYAKLYVDNQNLEVFYKAALIGRKTKQILKHSTYSSVVQNDLLFFTIYSLCIKKINAQNISYEMLAELDIETIDDVEICDVASNIYDIYLSKGGTLKSGNGKLLLDEIKKIHIVKALISTIQHIIIPSKIGFGAVQSPTECADGTRRL